MFNTNSGFYGQQRSQRQMLQPNMRSSNAPRSIAEDEEEGTAQRHFTGKKRRKKTSASAKQLAKKLQF